MACLESAPNHPNIFQKSKSSMVRQDSPNIDHGEATSFGGGLHLQVQRSSNVRCGHHLTKTVTFDFAVHVICRALRIVVLVGDRSLRTGSWMTWRLPFRRGFYRRQV
jgi:hypothetical protein